MIYMMMMMLMMMYIIGRKTFWLNARHFGEKRIKRRSEWVGREKNATKCLA
jgi:hypothetical protein